MKSAWISRRFVTGSGMYNPNLRVSPAGDTLILDYVDKIGFLF